MLHDAGGPPLGKPSLTWLWTDNCSLSFAPARPRWMARAELLFAGPLPARGTCGRLRKVHCSSLLFPDHPGPGGLCSLHLAWPHQWKTLAPSEPHPRPPSGLWRSPGKHTVAAAPPVKASAGLPPALPLDPLHVQHKIAGSRKNGLIYCWFTAALGTQTFPGGDSLRGKKVLHL